MALLLPPPPRRSSVSAREKAVDLLQVPRASPAHAVGDLRSESCTFFRCSAPDEQYVFILRVQVLSSSALDVFWCFVSIERLGAVIQGLLQVKGLSERY